MKTVVVDSKSIKRQWYVIDAAGMTLGRLASGVATVLIGKATHDYSPNQDHGDNVIVVNASKVALTGKKSSLKFYFHHSMQPGGARIVPFTEQMKRDPTKVIRMAVHGMVPKTSLGRQIMRKLHVYPDDLHPHQAQKPQARSLVASRA